MATEASEQVAARFIGAITATSESLRHFPASGPTREQLSSGLRVIFHSPYAVYYRPLPDAVVIIRAIHGARDIMALADCGGLA